jgi:hypothetical protein
MRGRESIRQAPRLFEVEGSGHLDLYERLPKQNSALAFNCWNVVLTGS